MAFPTVTPLANAPTAGSGARIYMAPYLDGAGSLADTDEVPLTGENHGISSSGSMAEFNTNNGGRLVVKTRNDKSFSIATAARASNAKIQELIDAANATGDPSFMYFAILNPDGTYDYGVCVVGDRNEEGADPDGIHTRTFSCEVIGEGSFQGLGS
jgi:hypothetical protein